MSEVLNGTKKWRLDAASKQDQIYELLGDRDYDLVNRNEIDTLQIKISRAISNKYYEECNADERQMVDCTLSKLLEISGSSSQILIGYVIVCTLGKNTREDSILPLIRTKKKYSDSVLFVEPQPGRVYNSWSDFEENNRLPRSIMCFPLNGFYRRNRHGILELKYRESPSCNNVFKVLDIVTGVGNVASAGILTASTFFPFTLPIVVGAGVVMGTTAVYSTSRKVNNLVDLARHDESIALNNPEALATWISIVTNVAGTAMAGASTIIPRLVAAGRMTSSLSQAVFEILSCISNAFNSFGILSGIIGLVLKCRDGKLGEADIQQFINTCLFVANFTINTVIAEQMIQTLSGQPSLLSHIFHMAKNVTFEVSKCVVDGVRFGFTYAMKLILGGNVMPILGFFGMKSAEHIAQTVANMIDRYQCGHIDLPSLLIQLYSVLYSHLNDFRREIKDAVETIMKYFGVPFKCINWGGGTQLFANSHTSMPRTEALEIVNDVKETVDTLHIANNETIENYSREILDMVTKFAKQTDCNSANDFKEVCSYVTQKMKTDIKERLIVKQADDPNTTLDFWDKKVAFDIVIKNMTNKQQMDTLKYEYIQAKQNRQNFGKPIFHRPAYLWYGGKVHLFDVDYNFWSFNNFIHDAACELLQCEELFDEATTFGLHNQKELFYVQRHSYCVVFCWEPSTDMERAIGLAMVLQKPQEGVTIT